LECQKIGHGPVLQTRFSIQNCEKSGVPVEDQRPGKLGKKAGRPTKKKVGRPSKTPPSNSTEPSVQDDFYVPSFAQLHPTPELSSTLISMGYADFEDFMDPEEQFVAFAADEELLNQPEPVAPEVPEGPVKLWDLRLILFEFTCKSRVWSNAFHKIAPLFCHIFTLFHVVGHALWLLSLHVGVTCICPPLYPLFLVIRENRAKNTSTLRKVLRKSLLLNFIGENATLLCVLIYKIVKHGCSIAWSERLEPSLGWVLSTFGVIFCRQNIEIPL
jgi:hypothetical protein